MISFKVKRNRKLIFTIGQEDTSILHANMLVSQGNLERGAEDYIRLSCGGLSHETEKGHPEHFRWKDQALNIGDTIEIEIVETDEIDPPIKRYRSDKDVQENPFTEEEIREMRYQDYLELKKQFEPDNVA